MRKLKLFLLLFVFQLSVCFSQNANRKFKKLIVNKSHIEIITNDGFYKIQPYSEKIIETTFVPNGEEFNPKSHAVVLKPKQLEFKVNELDNSVRFSTNGISVSIIKTPFQISYFYKNNEIISEKLGYIKNEENEILEFNLTPNEILYGGGARALGMNRRGNRLQLYNKAHYGYETHSDLLNFSIPMVISSKKYAVHFDNPPIGYLDLDSKNDNTLQYETISGRKTYQIIVGDNWYDLIDQYTDLTGKQPLIPRWALGNFSSRFGYHSQFETEETINKFKEEKIPVDAIIIDLYWFGKTIKETLGNFEFDKDSFPDPKKMISNLNKKGVKTVLISEPFVLSTSSKWDEAVKKDILGKTSDGKPYKYDFYFGNTGIIDIFKPEGKQWFWDIYKKFTDYGVAGWWGDLGEPEMHPSDLLHHTGTADEVHNIYGHNWAKLIYEGYKKDFPNQRPFILMRAGYSGSQKFGLIPWSGDVSRSWGGFQSQPEIALQMGMQGLGFMHSDLGGFAGANPDNKLYVRWLQYGVFQPIYRPHAHEDVPSEPVFRKQKTKNLAKKAIELRYQLLPYNYTIAFENNQKGTPLMRPLFFEESENENAKTNDKTYFWGKNILVSPIVKDSVKTKEVYFPSKSNWFNFYTNKKIKGGQTKTISVSDENIPTHIRGGAFIPMIKTIQNTTEYSLKSFDLHFYFDKDVNKSSDKLYNDDGLTPMAFEKGKFEILSISSLKKRKSLIIEINQKIGENYQNYSKEINVIIHNFPKTPKNLEKYNPEFDDKNKTLNFKVLLKDSKSKKIKIKY